MTNPVDLPRETPGASTDPHAEVLAGQLPGH